jgi:drug/metabolite transporter (DMT)-like permease
LKAERLSDDIVPRFRPESNDTIDKITQRHNDPAADGGSRVNPTLRFVLGIAAALASASAINLGFVAQKLAVARSAPGPLFPRLLRDRTWMLGILLQVALGAPLNIAAIGLLGPALVPGLMAPGLVVLALAASRWGGERLGRRELVGIALVMAAVVAIGASGLRVDVFAESPAAPALLARTAALAAAMAALALLGAAAAPLARRSGSPSSGPALLALASGSWLALSNLGIGVAQASAAWLGREGGAPLAALLAASVATVALANLMAMALTQKAFVSGDASMVIPLQQVPAQVFPVLVFFLVYRPFRPSALSLVLVASGVALVLLGAWLLGREAGEFER